MFQLLKSCIDSFYMLQLPNEKNSEKETKKEKNQFDQIIYDCIEKEETIEFYNNEIYILHNNQIYELTLKSLEDLL